MSSSSHIQIRSLNGHKHEVLALDCPDIDGNINPKFCLLSGSDDGIARLWDIRENKCKTTNCFCIPNKLSINSVQFGRRKEDIDNRIFIGAENCIYCYDFRKTDQIIYKNNDYLCLFPKHKDEINNLSISPNGNYLSVSDDTGINTLYSLQFFDKLLRGEQISTKPISIIQHSQQDNIICSCSTFITERQLISGGMDCTIAKWNIIKKNELFRINFAEQQQAQVFNPKYIYDLALNKKILAVATGNGSIFIIDYNTGNILNILEDIHASAVSQVCISPNNQLLTSGNDCKITLWNLPQDNTIIKPKIISKQSKNKRRNKKNKQKKKGKQIVKQEEKQEETTKDIKQKEQEGYNITKELTLTHKSKINSMKILHSSHYTDKLSFVIADQSNTISLYNII